MSNRQRIKRKTQSLKEPEYIRQMIELSAWLWPGTVTHCYTCMTIGARFFAATCNCHPDVSPFDPSEN